MADSFKAALDTITGMAEEPETTSRITEKQCLVACAQTLLLILPEVNKLHNFQVDMEKTVEEFDLSRYGTIGHKFDSLRDRIQSLEETVDSLVERLSALELAVNDREGLLAKRHANTLDRFDEVESRQREAVYMIDMPEILMDICNRLDRLEKV